jgi:RHS repeat-associated protein
MSVAGCCRRVISYETYDDWGALTAKAILKTGVRELSDLVTNYTVHLYDQVLDLYFAQARMYDAGDRRFTAVDPIKDSTNWYACCDNNPVRFFDPSGL